MGLIDSLSAGYRLVSRRWWLILIPVLLDLFLWMGPRLAVTEVVDGVSALLVAPAGVELGEGYADSLEQMELLLQLAAEDANLFTLLGAGLPGVPSLMATTRADMTLLPVDRMVTELTSVWQALLWGLAIVLAGTLLTSIYVSWVGRAVMTDYREEERHPVTTHTLQTWSRILLFILGLLILIIILGIPVVFLITLLMLLGQGVGILMLNLASIFLLWFGVWMAIYLYFVIDAIVLNRVNVLRAVWNSVNVVLRSFWPTVGLILLVNVISGGMTLILQKLAFASWSLLLGIMANAFVGSGLTAASLIFYSERFARWQESPNSSGIAMLFRNWGRPKHLDGE